MNKLIPTQIKKENNLVTILLILILLLNVFFLGFRTHEKITLKQNDLSKLSLIQQILKEKYLFSEDVPKEQIIDGAIQGMAFSMGDPYTHYITEKEYEEFKVQTQGSFGGIGVNITSDQNNDTGIIITNIIEGKGADIAGLKPDDIIVSVDGTSIEGMPLSEAIGLIRGEIGTSVVLEVIRSGEEKPITVIVNRSELEVPTVSHNILENNIGYIRYTTFSKSSVKQFDEAYMDLKEKGIQGLILDLRGNGGGLVYSALELGNRFLEKDQPIVKIKNKTQEENLLASSSSYKINIPVVILVDRNTASASEILSGALQDHNIAKLVGETTFGKGLIQETIPISDSSALVVTTSKYLTPNGRDIHKEGILPDEEVFNSTEDLLKGIDNQLNKGIELLSNHD